MVYQTTPITDVFNKAAQTALAQAQAGNAASEMNQRNLETQGRQNAANSPQAANDPITQAILKDPQNAVNYVQSMRVGAIRNALSKLTSQTPNPIAQGSDNLQPQQAPTQQNSTQPETTLQSQPQGNTGIDGIQPGSEIPNEGGGYQSPQANNEVTSGGYSSDGGAQQNSSASSGGGTGSPYNSTMKDVNSLTDMATQALQDAKNQQLGLPDLAQRNSDNAGKLMQAAQLKLDALNANPDQKAALERVATQTAQDNDNLTKLRTQRDAAYQGKADLGVIGQIMTANKLDTGTFSDWKIKLGQIASGLGNNQLATQISNLAPDSNGLSAIQGITKKLFTDEAVPGLGFNRTNQEMQVKMGANPSTFLSTPTNKALISVANTGLQRQIDLANMADTHDSQNKGLSNPDSTGQNYYQKKSNFQGQNPLEQVATQRLQKEVPGFLGGGSAAPVPPQNAPQSVPQEAAPVKKQRQPSTSAIEYLKKTGDTKNFKKFYGSDPSQYLK